MTLENLTIMFTDIVGFSDLVAKLSRGESEKLLKQHDLILNKVIKDFGGVKIKSVGDSFLVTFRSPTDAVLCGMAMHDALWDYKQHAKHPITIRVALNVGEVRREHKDVFGDAVNIASRLEKITPANAVYLTEAVYLSMSRSEAVLEWVDDVEFKGANEQVSVYQASNNPLLDESGNAISNTYPYGGAHIHYSANDTPLLTTSRISVALCSVFLLAVFATWWLTVNYSAAVATAQAPNISEQPAANIASSGVQSEPAPPPVPDEKAITEEIKGKAVTHLATNSYLGLQAMIAQYQSEHGQNPYLLLLSAHADIHFKRYSSALKHYQQAFEADPLLAEDPLAANNMMVLLKHRKKPASLLIANYMSQAVIEQLAKRTGEQGLNGRYEAFYLLKHSGNQAYIDRVGLNIWDLRELKKCKLKKVAVVELKRLKDERALAALKEVVNVGFFERFKYSCLRKTAKQAIKLIEGNSA